MGGRLGRYKDLARAGGGGGGGGGGGQEWNLQNSPVFTCDSGVSSRLK